MTKAELAALIAEQVQAALAAQRTIADSATDLNNTAPQAVSADAETKADADEEKEVKADCDVADPGSTTVKADGDDETDTDKAKEVKADADDKENEVKADADEEKEVKADADTEVKADNDEESEVKQNAQIAALQAQIETLTKAIAGQNTLSDADATAMGQARLHADAAMQSVGKPAMQPFPGEKPLAYRKRVLNELKCFSDSFKTADVSSIADSATLELVESKVFADAAAFAKSGAGIPKNQMRQRKHTTDAGHTIVEYDGSPRTWLQETDIPATRVGAI